MTFKRFTASLLASALLGALGMAPALAQYGNQPYPQSQSYPQPQNYPDRGTHTPGIDRMQQAISARIQQGLASGYITPGEAQVLYRRDREIQRREDLFKANGNASPQERQLLRAELEALSAEVDYMMTNRNVVRQPPPTTATPGIDRREFEISVRIDEGVRTGRISEREAHRLNRWARDIERREALFKSDGMVTQQERAQLREELITLQNEVERLLQSEPRRHGNGVYGHH